MIACSGVNLRLLHVVYRVWDTWTVVLLKERGPAAAIASYADGKRNTPGTRGVGGVRGAVRHLTHQLRPLTCPCPLQSGILYPVVVRFTSVNYAGVSTNNYGLSEVEAA